MSSNLPAKPKPLLMLSKPVSKCDLGGTGEAAAARYLEQRGLSVIARNLRCRAGELDLVCLEGETLVIIEVRVRRRHDFGGALASVTPDKQRRLRRAASFHWQRRPDWQKRVLRFDVVGMQNPADGAPDIVWVKDAFRD